MIQFLQIQYLKIDVYHIFISYHIFTIPPIRKGIIQDQARRYIMSKKTVCRKNEIELSINYQKLQKNIGKLIKILNQVDSLFVIPRHKKATLYPEILPETFTSDHSHILRSNIEPKEALIQQQYLLNSNQAIQLIWRSAYIIKQLGAYEAELKQIQDDMHKGFRNQLTDIILKLGGQIQLFSKKKDYHTPSMQVAKKHLLRLDALRQKINTIWKNAHQRQTTVLKNIFQDPWTGLIKIQFQPRQRELVLGHIFRKIIELDRALFKDSILFILEIQEGQRCVVVLQQSYPSFIIQSKQLQELIGLCSYYEGIQNFNLLRRLVETNKIYFQIQSCVMCHRCRDIQIRNAKKEKKDFLCSSKNIDPDPTTTPYAYQQIMLFSNYTAIPDLYADKLSKDKQKDDVNMNFKRYVHPFAKTNNLSCSRYLCEECVHYYQIQMKKKAKKEQQKNDSQNEKDDGKQQVNKKKKEKKEKKKKKTSDKQKFYQNDKFSIRCQFCECQCECERCSNSQCLNKFIALYCTFGGLLNNILEHLIFWNESNSTRSMKIISASDINRYCSKIDDANFNDMLNNKKKPILSKAERKMQVIIRRSKHEQKRLKQLLKKQQEEIQKFQSSQKNDAFQSQSSHHQESNQNSLSSSESRRDEEKIQPNRFEKNIKRQLTQDNKSERESSNHLNNIQAIIKTKERQTQDTKVNYQRTIEYSFQEKQPQTTHKVKLEVKSYLQQERLDILRGNSGGLNNDEIISKSNYFSQPKIQMLQSPSESEQLQHEYLHLKELFRMIINKQEAPVYSLNQSSVPANKKIKYQSKHPVQQSYELDETNNDDQKIDIAQNNLIVPLDQITTGKIRVKRHRRRRQQIRKERQQTALLSIVKQQYVPNKMADDIKIAPRQNQGRKPQKLKQQNRKNIYSNQAQTYDDESVDRSNNSSELFFESDDQK